MLNYQACFNDDWQKDNRRLKRGFGLTLISELGGIGSRPKVGYAIAFSVDGFLIPDQFYAACKYSALMATLPRFAALHAASGRNAGVRRRHSP